MYVKLMRGTSDLNILLDVLCYLADRSQLVWELWSKLPSKCQLAGCEGNVLRWMEDEVEFKTGPHAGAGIIPICRECVHKLRRASFRAGSAVVEREDGWVEYRPVLETQESEPLE